MSLRFEDNLIVGGSSVDVMVFDNPQQKAIYYVNSGVIRSQTGFRFTSVSGVTIPKSSLFLWYRFTNEGMLIGYYANTSNLTVSVPSAPNTYYIIFYFNFKPIVNTGSIKKTMRIITHITQTLYVITNTINSIKFSGSKLIYPSLKYTTR